MRNIFINYLMVEKIANEENDDVCDPNFYYEWTDEMTAEAEKLL